ncbi:MAG: TonB-dependent receptor [Muribaculaceae bacterium]|nr:TonB-dependent receptor [Muribaculaceae bacterium]
MKWVLSAVISVVSLTGAADTIPEAVMLRNVDVTARRPMKEIGVRRTLMDSVALRENVALSLADVLAYNSSIFVKDYGRATLSTVAFRGTSPSHTQVTWNGMRINSPMLGMTDFSTIPAYFIDRASLLHGSSSINDGGGGLGGAVSLSTAPDDSQGLGLQYVQGIGSFSTFDEFAKITYGTDNWHFATRAVYSSSPNDFKYRNHDRKENIYDDNHNIIGQYYPEERNRSGAFRDFHLLQEVYYDNHRGDRAGISAWYFDSNRELPLLTVDYGSDADFDNRQKERTLRAVASWDHRSGVWKSGVKAGYTYTRMAYDFSRDIGQGVPSVMARSRSNVHTVYGHVSGEYMPRRNLLLTVSLTGHQQMVESRDLKMQAGGMGDVGYDCGRMEWSGAVSVKWRPLERLGIAGVVREDIVGTGLLPIIPSVMMDYSLSNDDNLLLKASVSRNYRYPSLNDLYFMPGGNPDLRPERGFTYDAGFSWRLDRKGYRLKAEGSWFDSRIDDWIMWLPTTKGFYTPRNVRKVHAYGVEARAECGFSLFGSLDVDIHCSYSWTPSVNDGEKMTEADRSVGRQLPYVPRHTANVVGRISWHKWALEYKWLYYSRRFTQSSNDMSPTGYLPEYFMNNMSVERMLSWRWADITLKGVIRNLFNEDYLSVLARPMPGINFQLVVAVTPKFRF